MGACCVSIVHEYRKTAANAHVTRNRSVVLSRNLPAILTTTLTTGLGKSILKEQPGVIQSIF